MISPTRNELLQGILTTIFLTATAIESAEESQCINFGADCTCEQRPLDCPDEIPCCRFELGFGHSTYCLRNSSVCPFGTYECNSSDDPCMHGICCQYGNRLFCVCQNGYGGTYCLRRINSYSQPKRRSVNNPCPSTTEQMNSRVYTTARSLAETTANDEVSPLRGSRKQPPAMSIGLTTFVVVTAGAVLLCIASVFIARLVFKRKNNSLETGIKSGNTDAEKKYQNLKTSRLNEDGEIADHYDTLELYDKGYDTIDEHSLEDPNYEGILDSEYLDVVAEADDGNVERADDNDYAAAEEHQSRQTEANNDYEAFLEQESPSIDSIQ